MSVHEYHVETFSGLWSGNNRSYPVSVPRRRNTHSSVRWHPQVLVCSSRNKRCIPGTESAHVLTRQRIEACIGIGERD
ncbi:unnamed protein product [Sphenostylis stenocarpa]|uniref:Uncharacterized protein n=1 Tax=Sphenostylis stenocarpa TaxID=92480 RepID=A0AA86SPK2_9FABA|nr:unnamed protein product [Sphenostylis stenocarpa]